MEAREISLERNIFSVSMWGKGGKHEKEVKGKRKVSVSNSLVAPSWGGKSRE